MSTHRNRSSTGNAPLDGEISECRLDDGAVGCLPRPQGHPFVVMSGCVSAIVPGGSAGVASDGTPRRYGKNLAISSGDTRTAGVLAGTPGAPC
jgi:hypothetical protein